MSEDGHPIGVFITDGTTGETRLHRDTGYWEDDGFLDYIWSEGNYSCDCNRHLFFERAAGNDPDLDAPCGEGRYTVRIVNAAGKTIYEDTQP